MRWGQTAVWAAAALVFIVPQVTHAQSYMARGDITIKPARLSKAKVRLQLDRAEYALKSCYNKRLSRHKRLRGKVVARFAVRRDGTVSRSRASGIKHDVSACVARTIATLRFARLPRRVRVTVALGFDTNKYRLRRLMAHKRKHLYKMRPTSPHKISGILGKARGPGSIRGPMVTLTRPISLPRVHAGSLTAHGGIDKAIIRRYLRRWRYRFRRCYANALKRNPKLKGPVKLGFTIGANGRVIATTASGLNKTVATCLRREMKFLRFPRPRGGGIVKVRYPMYFSPPLKRPKNRNKVSSKIGTMQGGWGFGRSGVGPGGGGTGWGTIGTGRYGSVGRGSGRPLLAYRNRVRRALKRCLKSRSAHALRKRHRGTVVVKLRKTRATITSFPAGLSKRQRRCMRRRLSKLTPPPSITSKHARVSIRIR